MVNDLREAPSFSIGFPVQLAGSQPFAKFRVGCGEFLEFVFDVGDGEDFEIDVGFEKYFVLLLVEGELFDAVA